MALASCRFDRLDVDTAEAARLYELLDAGERAQAAAYRFDTHRRRFVVRRGRLREWLAPRAGIAPGAITFAANAYGKPSVTGWAGFFSASHSGEWMMLAEGDAEIGCDIERVDAKLDWPPLAAGLFAPAERAALAALDPSEGRASFFRCWARKEAFVKAIGHGLSWPLESFEVAVGPAPSLRRGGNGWAIAAPSHAGHACALVVREHGNALDWSIAA